MRPYRFIATYIDLDHILAVGPVQYAPTGYYSNDTVVPVQFAFRSEPVFLLVEERFIEGKPETVEQVREHAEAERLLLLTAWGAV